MKVLAFLQNAYTSSEEQALTNEQLETDQRYCERRQALLREAIAEDHPNFTYSILRRVFGPELCRQIWWTNASPRWGWSHEHKFPADYAHIRKMLTEQKPTLVLAFGKVAGDALLEISDSWSMLERAPFRVVYGPHPAARMPDKMDRLRAMRVAIEGLAEVRA